MDNQTMIFLTTPAPTLFPNPTIIQHGNTTPVSNMNDDVAKDITRIQTESLLVAGIILDSLTKPNIIDV